MSYTLKDEMKKWQNPYTGVDGGSDVSNLSTGGVDVELNNSLKPIDRSIANLEAEIGEISLDPSGQLLKIRGNKHSKGGTPLRLPQDSFIFSNNKKLNVDKENKELFKFKDGGSNSASNNTPAKVLSREVDVLHHNKMIAILKDPNKDVIAKTSARKMLEKNLTKVGQVAFLQEESKGFPQGIPGISQNTAPINMETEHLKQYKEGGLFKATLGIDSTFKRLKDEEILKKGRQIPISDTIPFKNNYSNVDRRPIRGGVAFQGVKNVNLPIASRSNSPNVNWGNNAYTSALQKMLSQGVSPEELVRSGRMHKDNLGKARSFYKPKTDLVFTKFTQPAGVPPESSQQPLHRGTSNQVSRNHMDFEGNPEEFGDFSNFSIGDYTNKSSEVKPNEEVKQDPISQYYSKVNRNLGQDISLGNDFYNALNIKKETPMRVQQTFTPLELEKINRQPFLNNVNTQVYSANRVQQTMNPVLNRAIQSRNLGMGLDKASEVEGNVYNQNLQISNSQNEYNNSGINATNNQNAILNKNYYDEVVKGNANFDNLRTTSRNKALETLVNQMADNEDLEYRLNSQPSMGEVWVDPRTNLPVKGISKEEALKRGYKKQYAPAMIFNPYNRRIEHSGIAVDMDSVPGSNGSGMPRNIQELLAQTQGKSEAEINLIGNYLRWANPRDINISKR